MTSRFEPWTECTTDANPTSASTSHLPPSLSLSTIESKSKTLQNHPQNSGESERVGALSSGEYERAGALSTALSPALSGDRFGKLFIYETQQEREQGYHQIVTFMHEILSSFRLRPEIIHQWTQLIHLHETDFLHLQFFMSMLSCPSVVRKLAALTDTKRFCTFARWLLHHVILAKHQNLTQGNAHELVHTIRLKWTTLC